MRVAIQRGLAGHTRSSTPGLEVTFARSRCSLRSMHGGEFHLGTIAAADNPLDMFHCRYLIYSSTWMPFCCRHRRCERQRSRTAGISLKSGPPALQILPRAESFQVNKSLRLVGNSLALEPIPEVEPPAKDAMSPRETGTALARCPPGLPSVIRSSERPPAPLFSDATIPRWFDSGTTVGGDGT